jgi:predicted metal-dependent hydrolase
MSERIAYLDIKGQKVPVKIVTEMRQNVRASLASHHVILRLPYQNIFQSDIESRLIWLQEWLHRLHQSKPGVLDKYKSKRSYESGDTFEIGSDIFRLEITFEEQESGKIRLKADKVLLISVPQNLRYDQQKLIRQLLIKFSQKYFLPYISSRVHYYNTKYFGKEINGVRLKYNKSNWGSCSAGKNLNFSVRLLFAPESVIDYVVVHELAHLVEMNHSKRFWDIVEGIIPDYPEKEKNLKENNGLYDF